MRRQARQKLLCVSEGYALLLVQLEPMLGMAGRSGTAYSLFSKEELPYLLDLHLFLSRPVQPAPLVPLSQAAAAAAQLPPQGAASIYGAFPQVLHCPLPRAAAHVKIHNVKFIQRGSFERHKPSAGWHP